MNLPASPDDPSSSGSKGETDGGEAGSGGARPGRAEDSGAAPSGGSADAATPNGRAGDPPVFGGAARPTDRPSQAAAGGPATIPPARKPATSGSGPSSGSVGDGQDGGTQSAAGGSGGLRETLISLTIALAMAFVAKTYVVEAYRIPTGSMAPTLLGAHMSFRGPATGHVWPVDTWYYAQPRGSVEQVPFPVQGGVYRAGGVSRDFAEPSVTDPMTQPIGEPDLAMKPFSPQPAPMPTRAGDRILVQKYLYEFRDPRRWEVTVFKNPSNAQVNYIKRLVGEENEALWLVDGDVFTRPAPDRVVENTVELLDDADAWSIQRKPLDVQRRLWRPVFSSEFRPLDRPGFASPGVTFRTPWEPTSGDWDLSGRVYELASDRGSLAWDTGLWPVTDFLSYNEVLINGQVEQAASALRFPVGDVRVRVGVEPAPGSDAATASVMLETRGLEFRARVGAGRVLVEMRSEGAAAWETLAERPGPSLPAGRVTNIEVWHADQAITVVVDGDVVVSQAAYELGPIERLEAATGESIEAFLGGRDAPLPNGISDPRQYRLGGAEVSLAVSGGPARLHRVGLDKDLYYRPFMPPTGRAFGGHPENIAILGEDEYFVLGDNSAASLDSRGWKLSDLDPWVEQSILEWASADDDQIVRPGVVPRKLMLGKAFFVYWPATHRPFNLFVPDTGRMRLIY